MLPNVSWLDVAWGDRPAGRALRAALLPAEWLYRGGVALRNGLFDAGVLSTRATAVPCVSIGNVSVGGTGKTPLASFVAGRLRAAGARPAIILRGYGDDEVEVHRLLAPGVEVIANADRVAGAAQARARGCDVAVLDDAFQHRRAHRVADVVLVSADGPWPGRCLPAGPLREPWTSLRRADLAVIVRKAAPPAAAEAVARRLAGLGMTSVVRVSLSLDLVHAVGGMAAPMQAGDLAGRPVLAIAGVGNPGAFFGQLRECGARVSAAPFPDHHPYGLPDVEGLIRRAESAALVVTTLKDAVKLRHLWPRSGPTLWYVSQRVVLEGGQALLEDVLRRVLAARTTADP